ncbi:MAG: PKD domain-containing protein [Ekhidna sp.]
MIILIGSSVSSVSAQEFRKAPVIICPIDPHSYDTRVPLQEKLNYLRESKSARVNSEFKSNFQVNYNGFTAEAQEAFQFAVDIWASLISSDVDIVINANFTNLGAGVLGSAGASFLVRDFKNAPSDTTFYPIALAEKIAGEQLNLPGEPEINCSFSSSFGFYFGTDGNTPASQFDFVTIVLHELGHGLGFAGVEGVDDQTGRGTWDYFSLKSARYNEFVELGDGTRLFDLQNNSTQVGDAITGGNLFFDGIRAVQKLGSRPKMFAPSTYDGGSSFSHLDEATFPAGNPNSLMSPQVGFGESIFDPGVSLDIFADMGWFISVLDHSINKRVIDNLTDDIALEVVLRTDTNIVTNNLKVVYSTDDFQTSNESAMTETTSNLFSGSIPNPGSAGEVKYYFEGISDGLGRQVRSPMTANKYYSVFVEDIQSVATPFTLSDGDFESGAAGFFSISLEGGLDLWELGQPQNALTTSSSPANVWKTRLSNDIEDSEFAYKCALVSPFFNMLDTEGNYLLKFELGMELGEREGASFESGPVGANVEVTTDRGETWTVLGQKNDSKGNQWYNFQNDGGGTFSTNVFENEPGWILDSVNSVAVQYNISEFAGNESVAFRIVFHVESDFLDEGYASDGVLIDNFEIAKESPSADFIVANSTPLYFPGDEVRFEYISSGATSYLWDFGDGNTSTDMNPIHMYSTGGLYDVSLTINYTGGSDVEIKTSFISVISKEGSSYALADGGNFESDNGDFIAGNIAGTGFERGNSNITGKNGTTSGDFAWVTGLSNAEYVDQSEAFLFTPLFDFSSLGNYELSFSANYATEDGWDGFIIEYTDDLGVTWKQLDTQIRSDWYDRLAENNPDEGWPAIPLFTGTTNGQFETKKTNISEFGGEGEIAFRFHWLSDRASTDVGIAIDDFKLEGPIAGPAVPNFTVANMSGCEGQQVTFTNTSTGSISQIEWDFGANASPATATGLGPHVVTYSGDGTSTVTLTVTSPENGITAEEKVDVITTSALHEPIISQTFNNDGTYTLTVTDGDSHQWLRNGEIIDGETGTSITVTVGDGGEFTVLVTIGSCQVETRSLIVNSVLESSLSIYPNPAEDYVTLKSGIVTTGNYRILNLTGNVVIKGEIDSNETKIDVSELSDGIYLLKLDSKGESAVRRIVVEKQ